MQKEIMVSSLFIGKHLRCYLFMMLFWRIMARQVEWGGQAGPWLQVVSGSETGGLSGISVAQRVGAKETSQEKLGNQGHSVNIRSSVIKPKGND